MAAASACPTVNVGDRIRLIRMGADPAPMPAGSTGTVWKIDALGRLHVTWDCGRDLALVPEADLYERVESALGGVG